MPKSEKWLHFVDEIRTLLQRNTKETGILVAGRQCIGLLRNETPENELPPRPA
jgi:hypothetical protein